METTELEAENAELKKQLPTAEIIPLKQTENAV
jgi:hypothetical protein